MKYLLTLKILLIVAGICSAQTKTAADTTENFRQQLFTTGRVTFGVKAGITYTNLHGRDLDFIFAGEQSSGLPSFHAGITVNSKIGKYFWLKHELLLIQKGAGVTLADSINTPYSSPFRTLYLDVFPVSLAFHKKGFQLYAGPYIGALLDAHITRRDFAGSEFKDHTIFGDASQFEDRSKYLQKFDFGIHAGIEYEFSSGLSVGIRYLHGATDLFQFANSYTLDDPKKTPISIHNRAFLLSIGYSFCKRPK